jgi:hypothetical protein
MRALSAAIFHLLFFGWTLAALGAAALSTEIYAARSPLDQPFLRMALGKRCGETEALERAIAREELKGFM